MAEKTYGYSISVDFPNQAVSPGRLTLEIEDSDIVIALDRIDTSGDTCNVVFKDSLSTGDEGILDGLIANHSGEPLPSGVTPVILEPTGDSSKNLQIYVVDFEADLNGETSHEVAFQEERQIQGVSVELENHTPGVNGDSLRIAIVALLEISPGVYDWVEYRALACGGVNEVGCPVPPSGIISVVAEGSAPLPPAVAKLKFTYNCVKTIGDKPYVHLVLRTWV